jgi:predicted RNase H-like HicB family nuclease
MKKSEVISLIEIAERFAAIPALQATGYKWIQSARHGTLDRPQVIVEQAEGNWSAYSPDAPGCIATGASAESARRRFHSAFAFHQEGQAPAASRRGSSIAVQRAIVAYNISNPKPIEVYKATGYDGTPAMYLVISTQDMRLLKGFLLKEAGQLIVADVPTTRFRIIEKLAL